MIKAEIVVINGPNLGSLGRRDASLYGLGTLQDLESALRERGQHLGVSLRFFQSNHEGELIDCIAGLDETCVKGILINPGGLAHTSVVLRDAIEDSVIPAIEVHLTQTFAREAFRQSHITAGACKGLISGLGFEGYRLGLDYLALSHTHTTTH